jgi:fatty-acyl-CoA synthase
VSIYDDMPLSPASNTPLTPLRFLDRASRYHGDKVGLVHGEDSWTWREIDERCRRLASALIARGVSRGDTVSVLAPNGPAIFEAHFGVPMTGAVLNNINVRLEPATLAFILNHNEAKFLLVDVEYSAVVKAALPDVASPPTIIDIVDPHANCGERIGALDYEALISEGDPAFRVNEPASELQPISLNYTSGTTGNPKGVVYDHRNAYVESLGNMISWNVSGQPRLLWVVPIFHANGWCYLWPMAAVGATNVLLRRPSGAAVFAAVAKHDITDIFGAPIIAHLMAQVPAAERPNLSRRVRMLTAGAPPTSANFQAMEEIGIDVDQGYGLTEVWGPAIFRERAPEWVDLPPAERARLKTRQGIPNLALDDVIVADPHTLECVPRDGKTMGEVLFRGNVIMRGYLKDPKATADAFEGGYFHSGDLAVWHPDGSIELKDRSKDIIISGGENISSIELENVLSEHPMVIDAAVVGIPDPKWGETPWAFVELRPDATATGEDILVYCRRRLVNFKVPKGVTFGAIPKTVTGKVQKFLLRQQFQDSAV